jgi:hypothetical protein
VKVALRYSSRCNKRKRAPKATLNPNHPLTLSRFWALLTLNVTLTLEERRMMVLRRGTPIGFTASMPMGGQEAPVCTLGDRALSKNAQNPLAKRAASLRRSQRKAMMAPDFSVGVVRPAPDSWALTHAQKLTTTANPAPMKTKGLHTW